MIGLFTDLWTRQEQCLGLVGLRTSSSLLALAAIATLSLSSSPASSETISEALAQAYRTNPTLDAARATLRATDEQVAIANSGYRPTVTGNATNGLSDSTFKTSAGQVAQTENHPRGYGVTATQTLFRGGQIINTVRAAEAQVRAQRETLRATEEQVLLASSTSYLDVIQNLAIVKLRENNVNVLSQELKQTRERFAVGEVTRTDVAQAEASLAASVSALNLARSNLQTSQANYEQNIGSPPGRLVEPKSLKGILPRTVDDAIAISARENPNVVAALYLEQQARHVVDQTYGQLLPTAQLQAAFNRNYDVSSSGGGTIAEVDSKTITGTVTVPLYTGGSVDAQVRQAKQTQISRIQQIEQARTQTKASVVSAWSTLIANRAQLVADQTQVSSAQIALTGVREEERVGQRTELDVLNAEQVLLNAKVAVVTDQHNVAVSEFTVLSNIGRLNIQELGAVESVYDPEQHYHEVRRQWWGISITRPDGRIESHDLWETHGRQYSSQEDEAAWKPLK